MYVPIHSFPFYSSAERWADGAIHAAGSLLALSGALWLLMSVPDPASLPGVFVYCVGLVATITLSASYNLAPSGPAKEVLRRADHAMIYVLIAATYTPFAASRLTAPLGTLVLLGIWLCAMAGVTLKLAAPRRFETVGVALCLAMGWMVIALIKPLSEAINATSLVLFLAGAGVYSAGLVFHFWKRLPFHNAIWHGFVLVAAGLHFGAIAVEFVR